MKLEHRKDNRVILSVPLRYKVFQLENLEQEVRDQVLGLKGEMKDLSLGGLQIQSDRPLETGGVLELELEIPGKGLVRSVAKVIWCRPTEGPGAEGYLSGIQFIPVYEEDLKTVKDYFKVGD